MFNTVAGKRIAVLGFAFKKDTGDTRETPAIDVCKGLLADRAKLNIFDPQVTEAQIHEDLHLGGCRLLVCVQGSGSRLERAPPPPDHGGRPPAPTPAPTPTPTLDPRTLPPPPPTPSAGKFEWDHPRTGAKATAGTPRTDDVAVVASAYDAARGAHGLAVLTEWDEFKGLDYQKIYDGMMKPAFVFDGRNILDHAALREIGFVVYALGKPLDPFLGGK